jgi:predicted ABC-type ATPase
MTPNLENFRKDANELSEAIAKRIARNSSEDAVRKSLVADKLTRRLNFAKYNPDQERDEHGRFGSGGGSVPAGTEMMYHGEKFVKGKDSLAEHLISDGKGGYKLDAAKQAEHDAIKAHFLEGVPKSNDPTMHFLGGGPASGKSNAVSNPAMGFPKTIDSPEVKNGSAKADAVVINADLVKDQLKEYQDRLAAHDPTAAGYCHEESSMLAKEIYKDALAQGKDVVFDGVGNTSKEAVEKKINDAQSMGYKVIGTYVTCPTDTAVERANARAEKTGRVVPESVVRQAHAAVSRIFPEVSGSFDQVRVVDTTRGGQDASGKAIGAVIAEGNKGENLTVHDPAAYAEFLGKAQEGR